MSASAKFAIHPPLKGVLQPITSLPDPVFAEKMMGDGVAIDPTDTTLYAPISGKVTQIHPSHHAVTLSDGTHEVLVHIGLDTVTLRGEGFKLLTKEGDTVKAGAPLLTFDADIIGEKAISLLSAVVVTSGEALTPILPFGQEIKDISGTLGYIGAIAKAPTQLGTAGDGPSSTETAQITIPNPVGLHARPAARIVAIARKYSSAITLRANGNDTRADSVTGIMALKTKFGDSLVIEANGPDAGAALAELLDAIFLGLGEDVSNAAATAPTEAFDEEEPLISTRSTEEGVYLGYTAAPGRAIGKLTSRKNKLPPVVRLADDKEAETTALLEAIYTSRQDIRAIISSLQERSQDELADVFFAHCQLLEDPDMTEAAQKDIASGCSAAWSWQHAYKVQAEKLAAMDDPLLAGRAADVRDVGERVLRKLLGLSSSEGDLQDPSILLMEDITPSEIVMLDLSKVVGLCTHAGGSASHAAIIARSNNLPYLVNVERGLADHQDGTELLLDAKRGTIRVAPSADEIAAFKEKIEKEAERRAQFQAAAQDPAITTDGVRIEIAANIGSKADAEKAVAAGAEAVGLLRSEFLYLERLNAPSEEEQGEEVGGILEVMGKDRPVIIRTLDVGGDKPLPYLPLPEEENPFLGLRGVRIGIERPSILRSQVRAILSQANKGRARIMFPMIAALDELRAVKALVREEEKKMGIEPVEIGIMIEVPSAALMADKLAAEVDFFSVGTNDLTQYVLAIDRGHAQLASRANPLHPAILRMIDMTVKAADANGKWVGVCGGLASQSEAVPVLIGLGVKELSVSVPSLPEVKQKVRELSMSESKELARQALQCADTADVLALVKPYK
ncbi:phosphoenolpyruvate--protein phosphotransferase [Polycladidibacter hongkongensis]|uniref:phosphoenolpyruvate--protein phosphotransferase n=1 Tax=Polycladidibacter hongkongensis TaxID=1647556 RepID=UPI00082A4E8B|nr:phosphoenolpyruvate--protein phosphotransferase [Pseudovibrio hongkongensis]